jgi:hypothetical protein
VPLTRPPFVPRAVLMNHHPGQGLAFPFLAMRAFLQPGLDPPRSLSLFLYPAVAACAAGLFIPGMKVLCVPA